MDQNQNPDLFQDVGRKAEGLSAQNPATGEEERKPVEEVESLCMNCHQNGITRLLLTRIPYFREIVIMSFSCPHCGFQNSEIQPAGEIQQRGSKYTFTVEHSDDLQRQVVKSDTSVFRIEDLDLEIPAGRGQLSNVEGIISMIKQDLSEQQEDRKQAAPEVYEKIEQITQQLGSFLGGSSFPFKISLDDPAGNSWIEPSPLDKGNKLTKIEYTRSAQENAALGLADTTGAPSTEIRPEYKANQMVPAGPPGTSEATEEEDIVEGQVYSFPASCPGCVKPCMTNMKMVNIPFFKQVVIMSTVCDHCGYRSNEVRTGGEIPEKGRRITLKVNSAEDLSRDILKSETCALQCPDLSLEVQPGTMGGRFTTVEGLLTQVRDDLKAQIFETEGASHDSMLPDQKTAWENFFNKITDAIEGKTKFTVVLEDPIAGSYVQSFTAPEPDPQLQVEDYVRTDLEEEELGLKDMKVEGYENNAEEKAAPDADEVMAEANARMAEINEADRGH